MTIDKKYLKQVKFIGHIVNSKDNEIFKNAMTMLINSFKNPKNVYNTIFSSDSLITWGKNLSFLRDEDFLRSYNTVINYSDMVNEKQKGLIWRSYIFDYFANNCVNIEGDFLELGVYKGDSAHLLCDRIEFNKFGKNYYLYDLFVWKDGDDHISLTDLSDEKIYDFVVSRFSKFDFVKIIRGKVPDSLEGTLPEKVAFAHIDMNNADAEAAAFEAIYPRLSVGGAIIFDDYGWWQLSDQKIAIDKKMKAFGQRILELPTGQGLLLKY